MRQQHLIPHRHQDRTNTTVILVLAVFAVVGLLVGACSTAPMDQSSSSQTADSHLRSGPQTATLPGSDVTPVTTSPTTTLPVTVDSDGGGKVTVTDTSRIIAVDRNGTLGNIVFALGLGSRVVGRDQSTTFPSAAKLPVVTGNGHQLNSESVLALNPTVVLVDAATTPPQAVDAIRASQIPVVTFSSTRTIATTADLIRSVAAALGVKPAGEQLVKRTESEITAAKATLPHPTGDPKIAFLYIRGPHLVLLAGPNSGADDLVAALGGTDAGTAAGLTAEFTAVTAEALLRANPDVILVMTQGADSVGGLDGVLALPGVSDTNAGRARRVVQMDETEVLSFGPDVGKVIGALGHAIYT
ncbi:hemin ABC transporter substrate binding protein [Gordonia polyisoprenivorans NBRC 16320 = JCM 10675]|uniref:ABC transporter substrate-binding protein n=1 Tax=Gordonia polyisoprenivorans TaxID=84595 RepID=A0A846WPG1_9ACTN|nr:ABC transporter substrate-binding protein [Gordonia polyisoprenivorans]NKY02670.1 ABC transporter substrate-binding protein [Gordonia polyisoprenivorans]OZC30198.1 ABC transporter substrate-binding protein [Gordonia polyisoprenivorans]GAB24651.1 hemin ABC transporter substrate binding protein [Gordonia polyisoprenivorans NBRC 16320 = JCM 10675]